MVPPSVLPGAARRGADASTPAGLEAVFWSSLQLLGYEERRHREKEAAGAGPAMFRRGNIGGLDSVLHFLLEQLLGVEQLRRDLRGCWPPADGRQRTEWKKFAKGHLDRLAVEGFLPSKLANAAGSLLHTASGNRLVELLCHLSSHVLNVVHGRMFADDEPLSAGSQAVQQVLADETAAQFLGEPLQRAGAARLKGACESFLRMCKDGAQLQAGWQATAEELTSEYRALLSQSASLQQSLKSHTGDTPALSQDEREKQMGLTAQLWEELHPTLDNIFHLNGASQFILEGTAHPNSISGFDLTANAERPLGRDCPSVDIAAMLESWTANVSDLQEPLTAAEAKLSAQEGTVEHSAARPLAGYSAAHLAHIRLADKAHKASQEDLLSLEEQLAEELKAAQARVGRLQEEVGNLMSHGVSPCQAAASTTQMFPSPTGGTGRDRSPKATTFKLAPNTPGFRAGAVDVATPLPSTWAHSRYQGMDLASVRRAAHQAADEVPAEPSGAVGASPVTDNDSRALQNLELGEGLNLIEEFAFQEEGSASPATPPSSGVLWDESGSPYVISLTPLVG